MERLFMPYICYNLSDNRNINITIDNITGINLYAEF